MTWAAELRGILPLRPAGLLARPADLLAARRLVSALRADGSTHGPPRGIRRTYSDLLVFRLDRGTGPPVMVKHPRSPRATASLGQECAAVRTLQQDDRLGAWRRLLPSVEHCHLDGQRPLVVERLLPGAAGDTLLHGSPRLAHRVATTALGGIRELHRATGLPQDVTHRLDDWVNAPLTVLTEGLTRHDGRRAATTAPLQDRLTGALTGRSLAVGWTHGDFHPGNVLLTPDAGELLGLVDWAGAVPDGPCAVDCYTFVLTLRHQREGRQFGRVVADVVRRARLLPEDRHLLAATGTPAAEPAEEAALTLLTWLWHVAGNLTKSTRYGRSRRWVADNVVPVLDEVAARQLRDARRIRRA